MNYKINRYVVLTTNHTPPQYNVSDTKHGVLVAFFGSKHLHAEANAIQYAKFKNYLEGIKQL